MTAGNVFKLPGSASGELACHVVREKAIEGRVEEKLKEHRKEEKDTEKDKKLEASFAKAAEGLELFSSRVTLGPRPRGLAPPPLWAPESLSGGR